MRARVQVEVWSATAARNHSAISANFKVTQCDCAPRCGSMRRTTIEQQLKMLTRISANQRLTFGLHLLYATGLRVSEVVAATVDDLQWVEYPADASDDQPMQGWTLRVIGKGQKERAVPLPIDVVGELPKYMIARGLNADPEDFGNQGAHLLGKASDTAERAPGLSKGQRIDPWQGITATTFYDQIKAFFADCAGVLKQQGGRAMRRGPSVSSGPARTGCVTRTPATPSPAGCRSRSRSRTWGMRRSPPPRSTSRPRSAGG